ncbi:MULTISPECIES: low temperature requirement protein A [unclassified Micromonospora]|uniref:low temperature requirement protein A n=1 Tax=unclassified Micromonospora TaxID=2617518 RepID=UPI001B395B84|nr:MULTISPECIES: low temperature requirement protein A [unclassified Micromonospora]MBQ1045137.1 low temperature requirement protein A [Micromonospora sp. C72]MBQ1058470.1 low temperature requirement protein A [Micromonospora sp. C32]
MRRSAPGSRTTPVELFYDLVFVFAFLSVTTLTASVLTPVNLYRFLLVLALLWWSWTGFARLGNAFRADQGVLPLVGIVTVAATFLLVLSTPSAFANRDGWLPGPLVFAGCYFVIRTAQLTVFAWADRADPARRRGLRIRFLAPTVATALLVVAGILPGRLPQERFAVGLQLALWTLALLVEYLSGAILGQQWWVVVSAGHWAERHALIVLVALGESIIALGLGPKRGLPLTGPVAVAALLGVVIVATLWWAYFDTLSFALEQALHQARDRAVRLRLARTVYTFLHLPMVAGIILFALGLKDLLAEATSPATPAWGPPLGAFWAGILFGGVGLYLLSIAGCWWLAERRVRRPLLVTVLLLVAAVPAVARLHELNALVVLAVLTVAGVIWETRAEDGDRRRVRQLALEEQIAAEAEQSRWREQHL